MSIYLNSYFYIFLFIIICSFALLFNFRVIFFFHFLIVKIKYIKFFIIYLFIYLI